MLTDKTKLLRRKFLFRHSSGTKAQTKGFFSEIYLNRYLYALAVPGMLFLIVFAYVPMSGHLLAFKDYSVVKGIFKSSWSGLENFKFFFGSPDWLRVTFNTIFLNGLFIVFGLSLAILIALFLNEIKSLTIKKFSQSIIFLPYFISWMAVSFMLYSLLNTSDGLINRVLLSVGVEKLQWYNEAGYWRAILTIIYVWKQAGYYSIIFLAAITGISSEQYEAATIDGANRFQQIIHITLPLISPTVIILALLAVGRIFYGDFGMIYSLVGDNGALLPTTDVIDTFSYRALRQLGNFSMASAVVLYQAVMGMVTIIIFNSISKRIDPESGLF